MFYIFIYYYKLPAVRRATLVIESPFRNCVDYVYSNNILGINYFYLNAK